MWAKIGYFILRQRIPLAAVMILLTAWMAFESRQVRMSYRFGGVLPEDDSTFVDYKKFTDQFSEDGTVLAIGYRDSNIWELQNFNRWRALARDLSALTVDKDGTPAGIVDSIFSSAKCYNLALDTTDSKFRFSQIFEHDPTSQEELDSLRQVLMNLPFYEGLLYQKGTDAGLMMVFVNAELFNSEHRGNAVERMMELTDRFTTDTGIKTYVSGMPYIRTVMSVKVKAELKFFTMLSAIICMVLLFFFFRSFKVTFVVMSVVVVSVVVAIGTIALFDYPITMLMGLIPPLMIVTTVPNCIYLVTKYHQEFQRYGNKTRALARVVQKAGSAAFMINATTAVGFATFIFTSSDLLKHFGVIASLNCMMAFFLSLLIFPIVYSFLPAPTERHLGHLNSKWLEQGLDALVRLVIYKRRWIYGVTIVVTAAGIYGISRIETTGNIVDDIPDSDRVITDLRWFEENFHGVMPFEILVESQRKGHFGKTQLPKSAKNIDTLQRLLNHYVITLDGKTIHPFAKSLSIVDAVKFANQGFNYGDPEYYDLPSMRDQWGSIASSVELNESKSSSFKKNFMDSTARMTRITTQIADIGTKDMDKLMADIKPKIDSALSAEARSKHATMIEEADALLANLPDTVTAADRDRIKHESDSMKLEADSALIKAKYNVTLTGTSVVFLEGTNYLVSDLFVSLLFGVLIISLMMAAMFWSARMVFISFIPNVIPQIITAGIMGFVGIPLKPSTILVFSIALGITVDNTIHYLAKYRQELKFHNWKIKESALLAIRETGASMVYTSLVLLFGFGCFAASEFEGTRALGVLTAVTLLVAMITNLLVLPALLLSFQKRITTKSFREPFFQLLDEEDDSHYSDWSVQKINLEHNHESF
ncbi:MAG: efflux RND transporter permease subunit [Flavobacteriales bacterium]